MQYTMLEFTPSELIHRGEQPAVFWVDAQTNQGFTCGPRKRLSSRMIVLTRLRSSATQME